MTVSADGFKDLSVDRLLDFSSATALTFESVDHNFTASSISR